MMLYFINRCLVPLMLFAVASVALAQSPDLEDLAGRVEARVGDQVHQFPLLESHYDVTVKGDLATVRLKQVFTNPLPESVHAQYLFPLNRHAAVYAMTMNVGDEVIRAVIKEKEEAKKVFVKAASQGKSAVLTEQHRPNMFVQKLANLTPGFPITVELAYTHPVTRIDGAYQLELPLVVGPRYQPEPDDKGYEQTSSQSITKVGNWELETLPAYPPTRDVDLPPSIDPNRVSLTIDLDTGINIQELISTTHAIDVTATNDTRKRVHLAEDKTIANRDFVLRYRLAGERTQAGILQHHDERGGFFSLLIEPPSVTPTESITPREMVFVLDTSGSMSGLPMDTSKMFMREALRQLRSGDTFRIIRFSDSATEFSQRPLPATPSNIQAGIRYTQNLHGGGGTVMTSGVRQALTVPVPQGTVRLVTFLTDGYIGNEATVLSVINENLNDARLFALGVGTSTNRYLLDEMARAGRGFVRYMDPTEEVEDVALELAARLQTPVLTDISIDFGDIGVTDIYPKVVPDLFEGDSLRIQGRFSQPNSGTVTIHGRVNGRDASLPIDVALTDSNTNGDAVALVWARSAIAENMRDLTRSTAHPTNEASARDELRSRIKKNVIDLGLAFSLTTRWTSFIAVSEQVYNANPSNTPMLDVPLEKVKGVSSNAYPAAAPAVNPMQFAGNSAPEPQVSLLLAVIGLLGAFTWTVRRFKTSR